MPAGETPPVNPPPHVGTGRERLRLWNGLRNAFRSKRSALKRGKKASGNRHSARWSNWQSFSIGRSASFLVAAATASASRSGVPKTPGIEPGHESPELRLALRQMLNRRENAINLMEELGEPIPDFSLRAHL